MTGSQAKTGYLSGLALLMALSLWQGCGRTSEDAQQHAPPAGTGPGGGGGSGATGGSAGEGNRNGSGGAAGSTAGSSGASGTASDGGEPPQPEPPPRPTWKPRFPLGAPGWRGSTVPFCSEDIATLEPRIWSTDGVVYLRVHASCNSLAGDPCNLAHAARGPIESLYRNDGSGWQRIYRREMADVPVGTLITGYQDGRLVISDENCPLLQVEPSGAALCLWPEQSTFYPIATATAGDVLVVLGAYGTESVPTELWKHDGTAWAKLHTWTADPPSSLAAFGTTAVAAGRNRLWTFDLASGTGAANPKVPAAAYYSVWTYGANDVLLGSQYGGLAHYDGSRWTTTDTEFRDSLYNMWGAADGAVFTYSQASFGRWKAGTFDAIVPGIDSSLLPSHYFADIWGNSATEVFLAVNDGAFKGYACGWLFLVWFDGTTFHQF
jgi:hypothetical protein